MRSASLAKKEWLLERMNTTLLCLFLEVLVSEKEKGYVAVDVAQRGEEPSFLQRTGSKRAGDESGGCFQELGRREAAHKTAILGRGAACSTLEWRLRRSGQMYMTVVKHIQGTAQDGRGEVD